ncbi:CST complex subunit CTC1 isoform X2 [Impatiens glandulifera]|uniref:CST complex subunit CTC1 isoform X2 n=1 Tax=Impatiens glandulifera TaxID=253017 RepID=UPI001FB12C44|nr:CST complex subunit CTC1 isoform X2 [Impatiens glandulifera]
MEDDVKIISIAELIRLSRPISGASSLSCNSSINPIIPRHSGTTGLPAASQNPKDRILHPLDHPAIIVGTLSLPTFNSLSTTRVVSRCLSTNCLSFSDDSFTVCCDVLDLDIRIIGRKIHVVAWNFIPLKCGGGFLEIICWRNPTISHGQSLFCSDPIPLVPGCSVSGKDSLKSGTFVWGMIESVSPVSVVSCTTGSNTNSDEKGNISGFLLQLLICECTLCCLRDYTKALSVLTDKWSDHYFNKPVIVYFCGPASSWHPVITRLLGYTLVLSGMKKKLVFIEKEESKLMYVTTEKAFFCISKWPHGKNSLGKVVQGKGECGMYTGSVTGIYMHGMVVELDKDVLLLICTNQLPQLPHSLRVGSVVSVKNAHFVNPKFVWAKILVLGACVKTSICLKSFSPLETGCYKYTRSQSLLGKFIDSLKLSARLWVLLLVSSFRKKFSGILSEKVVLGTQHKQGWVQSYACSCLPSLVSRSQQGVFIEFCKHDSCCCGDDTNYGNLKLVVPISDFVGFCEATWVHHLSNWKVDYGFMLGTDIIIPPNERIYHQSIRRVLQSEHIDVVLLGMLQISPSGRLQLMDATGSLDVSIPDLSPTWSTHGIHEVNDFIIVIEGLHEKVDDSVSNLSESFFYRSIFCNAPLTRAFELTIHLIYHLRNNKLINDLFHERASDKRKYDELEGGRFHLLRVTHKFPLQQKLRAPATSKRSTMFAEAKILCWDLVLSEQNGDSRLSNKSMEHVKQSFQEYPSHKRHKIESSGAYSSLKMKGCCNSHPSIQVPCIVDKKINGQYLDSPGVLYYKKTKEAVGSAYKPAMPKVLMEFGPESFCKLESLTIGGYYLIKHNEGDKFCSIKDIDIIENHKIVFSSTMHIWSLAFSYDDVAHPKTNPDICIKFSSHAWKLLKMKYDFLEDLVTSLSPENVVDDIKTSTKITFGNYDGGSHFPKGKLISLHGYVLAVYNLISDSFGYEIPLNFHMPIYSEATTSPCIHVLVRDRIVRIFGSLSKIVYPVGFGVGVEATFHRILVLSCGSAYMMLPASCIAIQSISCQFKYHCTNQSVSSGTCSIEFQDYVPSAFVSEILQHSGHNPLQFRCRVVALYFLLLENKNICYPDSRMHSRSSSVHIPLAGFILGMINYMMMGHPLFVAGQVMIKQQSY